MITDKGEWKEERRTAYAVYVGLQWALYRLPMEHPSRAALADAVWQADRHWRGLGRVMVRGVAMVEHDMAACADER